LTAAAATRSLTPMRLLVPALLALALLGCSPSANVATVGAHAIPFIEDDWSRALAEARQRDVPLFVEAWAPW
jgi:hypothetical protein